MTVLNAEPARARVRLDRLTSLRALAALAVFAYHLGAWNVWHPAKLAAFGYAGVSFFFVLSGFVLVWSAPAHDTARRFYARRFARIYPSYLVMTLVACVVPRVAFGRGLGAGLLAVTLTQAWTPAPKLAFGLNGVSWSLSCEATFYILFPLVLLAMQRTTRRQLLRLVLIAYVAGAAAVVVITYLGEGATVAFVNPLIRMPEFMLGMACGLAFSDGWRPNIGLRTPAVILVALYAAGGLLHLPKPTMDALLPLDFTAIVLAAACTDAAGLPGWLSFRWLVYAGEVSYCFYLVHELVIINMRPYLSGLPAVTVDLAGAVLAAVALHHLIELPFQRRLRPAGAAPPEAGVLRATRAPAGPSSG